VKKKAVVAQFQLISGNFPEEAKENHGKISVNMIGVLAEI
jgi:hypothetical protein